MWKWNEIVRERFFLISVSLHPPSWRTVWKTTCAWTRDLTLKTSPSCTSVMAWHHRSVDSPLCAVHDSDPALRGPEKPKILITRSDLRRGCLQGIIGLSHTLCYFEWGIQREQLLHKIALQQQKRSGDISLFSKQLGFQFAGLVLNMLPWKALWNISAVIKAAWISLLFLFLLWQRRTLKRPRWRAIIASSLFCEFCLCPHAECKPSIHSLFASLWAPRGAI